MTLVCQDWGGLTSLCCLPDVGDRFARLVIMNTGLPPHGRVSLRSRLNFMAWRLMVEAFWRDLPVGDVFGHACRGEAEGLGAEGMDHTRLSFFPVFHEFFDSLSPVCEGDH
jgi:pimeloyl-ACP methyl ester carboxylesterase